MRRPNAMVKAAETVIGIAIPTAAIIMVIFIFYAMSDLLFNGR